MLCLSRIDLCMAKRTAVVLTAPGEGVPSCGVAEVFSGTTGRKRRALDVENNTIERNVIIAVLKLFHHKFSTFYKYLPTPNWIFFDTSFEVCFKSRHFFSHPQR